MSTETHITASSNNNDLDRCSSLLLNYNYSKTFKRSDFSFASFCEGLSVLKEV